MIENTRTNIASAPTLKASGLLSIWNTQAIEKHQSQQFRDLVPALAKGLIAQDAQYQQTDESSLHRPNRQSNVNLTETA
jgi:hypothetical protein